MTETQNIHPVHLALGSNLGHREANLRQAIKKLTPKVTVLATSKLYETTPAYVIDQPAFLNIAVKGETALSPQNLLVYLKRIEDEMGREQTIRFGPRIIDLDIIFYDDWIWDTPDLQIPHPRLAERGFVLYPLAEIAAEVLHPLTGKSVMELAHNLPVDNGIIEVMDWQEIHDQ